MESILALCRFSADRDNGTDVTRTLDTRPGPWHAETRTCKCCETSERGAWRPMRGPEVTSLTNQRPGTRVTIMLHDSVSENNAAAIEQS